MARQHLISNFAHLQEHDEQLLRLVPRAYREYFPGKDDCANGSFYLHDGTAWSFFKGSLLDE